MLCFFTTVVYVHVRSRLVVLICLDKGLWKRQSGCDQQGSLLVTGWFLLHDRGILHFVLVDFIMSVSSVVATRYYILSSKFVSMKYKIQRHFASCFG